MVKPNESSAAVERYQRNKDSLIDELKRCLALVPPGQITTRAMESAARYACMRCGYLSGATASIFGKRDLVGEEKSNLVMTSKKAGYFACLFAVYGDDRWAKVEATPLTQPSDGQDDKDPKALDRQEIEPVLTQNLRQVYSWCLFGTPEPPPDAELSYLQRLNALQLTIDLDPTEPADIEPAAKREQICAELRVASPFAAAQYMRALAENVERRALQPIELPEVETEPPCNENCVLVGYLRFGSKVGMDVTDDDRAAISEATGIPMPRVARLLCGDSWTPAEEAAVDAYVNSPMFTLAMLQSTADARAKVNDQVVPLG